MRGNDDAPTANLACHPLSSKIEIINLDAVNLNELPELEQFILHKIFVLNDKFQKYFKNYDFHNLYKELLNFCTVDLSAFYFDIRKDNLYCDPKDSKKRKSTILLLNIILNALLKWFCLLYTSPSPRDQRGSRMPSSA